MNIDSTPRSFGFPCVFNPMEAGMAIEAIWPSLYIGTDRVDEIKRKTSSLPWAKEVLEQMQREAEEVLAETPQFVTELAGEPIGSAGRCRMFTDDGHYTQFDPQCHDPLWNPNLHRFEPPHSNSPEGWTILQHERLRRLMSSLGFLWRLTGNERFAVWAADGLRNLAACYEDYAKTYDIEETPYRFMYGGLYEAQAQLHIIQTLELLEGAPNWSAEDTERLRTNVITPGCEAISRWMDVMIVHNMSVWAMSALAQAGRCLGRDDFTDKAFHSDRCGVKVLLEQGLRRNEQTGKPDGFWFEHSPFYGCFYVVTAITPLVRAAAAAGVLTDDHCERYATFFDAMPHYADAELRLLSISDRVHPGTMRLTQTRHLYEYAVGQVDAKHAELLALLYERCGAPRNSWAALAFGPDELPPPTAPAALTASCVLPEANIVTFREDDVTLWFQNLRRYPGSAQGHHHMDKLSISLHAHGAVITSDLGWPGCETKECHRGAYLSGTLSHNTLMLDEYDQGPLETLQFDCDAAAAVPWAVGAVRGNSADKMWKTFEGHHAGRLQNGLYDDAVISRTVWFDYPYIVLLDELEAETAKRFGFVFHARGQMVARTEDAGNDALGLPALPADGAWSCFTGRAAADPVDLFVADWRVRSDIYLRAVTISDATFDAHWGNTPDNPAETNRGTVLLRAPGCRRSFATALELHHSTPTLAAIEFTDRGVSVVTHAGAETRYGRPERKTT